MPLFPFMQHLLGLRTTPPSHAPETEAGITANVLILVGMLLLLLYCWLAP